MHKTAPRVRVYNCRDNIVINSHASMNERSTEFIVCKNKRHTSLVCSSVGGGVALTESRRTCSTVLVHSQEEVHRRKFTGCSSNKRSAVASQMLFDDVNKSGWEHASSVRLAFDSALLQHDNSYMNTMFTYMYLHVSHLPFTRH